MAETAANAYATTDSNTAATSPTAVAVVNDGTGDRQIVVLGAGDGTTNLNDGSSANPINITLSNTGANATAVKVDGSAVTQPVSGTVTGTVTANAGTNLNTSALALETGGNLAAAKTDLDTIASQTSGLSTSANQTNGTQVTGTASAVVNVAQKTVNTTAVQLSASSTIPTNGIIVGALSTNTASIFIGASGVTTSTGAELTPGSSLPFTCNLNTLYIISVASTTDKIWYNVT